MPGGWRTVVTGAETDLGRRVAVALAKRGSTVDMLCGDEAGAALAVSALRAAVPEALGQVEIVDPPDLSAVATACTRLAANPIYAVVHAGIYTTAQPRVDARGIPWLTTVNVIAPYVATRVLAPSLLRTPYGRVIFLSMPYLGRLVLQDLRTGGDITRFPWVTYRARYLLAVELARRSEWLSSRIVVFLGGPQPAPGASSRQVALYRRRLRDEQTPFTRWFRGSSTQHVDEAASAAAYLAMAERVPGDAGRWCIRFPPRWRKHHKYARDPSTAGDVWNLCEELSAPVSLPGGL